MAPEPRTTSPRCRERRATSRSRAPNGKPSGNPATIRASSAPAASNLSLWSSASLPRSAATQLASGPADGGAFAWKMMTPTVAMGPSLASGGGNLTGRVRAYIGLGANLGDGAASLAAGVHALARLPGARLAGVSRLYATEPVGLVDQPEFRNAAAALDVPRGDDPETGAVALFIALKQLERAFGRQERQRWGPRELDLDLLLFGRHAISVDRPAGTRSADPAKPADLVVPHRLAGERLFVLAPLADLAPRLVPPGWRETVASARERRERVEGMNAVRPVARWGGDGWVPLESAQSRTAGGRSRSNM